MDQTTVKLEARYAFISEYSVTSGVMVVDQFISMYLFVPTLYFLEEFYFFDRKYMYHFIDNYKIYHIHWQLCNCDCLNLGVKCYKLGCWVNLGMGRHDCADGCHLGFTFLEVWLDEHELAKLYVKRYVEVMLP